MSKLDVGYQHHYAIRNDVYWLDQLVTISGHASYRLKNLVLVNHTAILKSIYYMYNEKVDYYYLHLNTPIEKNDNAKISIGSNCITEIRKPTTSEKILYKLEYEDIIGEEKISRSNRIT